MKEVKKKKEQQETQLSELNCSSDERTVTDVWTDGSESESD